MDENTFWKLIELVRTEHPDSQEDQCAYLAEIFADLDPADCISAGVWFDRAMVTAFHWPLWGAAFVIGGGCSDDAFTDFRAALILKGRSIYDTALRDPDRLAELNLSHGEWFFEGFQYVVHEAMDGALDEDPDAGQPSPELPEEPTGLEWTELELPTLLPRLTAKYA